MKTKFNYVILLVNIVLTISIASLFIFAKITNKSSSQIFNENINGIVEVKASTDNVGDSYGTGIIYDIEGYLITNAHVISYSSMNELKLFENIYIRFIKNEEYQKVRVIKYDTSLDLAILKIDESKLDIKPIKFSNTNYNYGDIVYAVGNTSNYGIGISKGIISVPEVYIKYNDVKRVMIQSDINISTGNSGGALLNNRGELIGITTLRTKDNYGNVNYGFTYSIPLKIVNEFVKEV